MLERLRAMNQAAATKIDWTIYVNDPMRFARDGWPNGFTEGYPGKWFYDKQIEILESTEANKETFAVAGHQLGKDFVAAFKALHYFISHSPCKVVITSVKDDHLRILFGELRRFIDTCKLPLTADRGGPLIVNHREIKKIGDSVSYLIGEVAAKGEARAGHHAPYSLFIVDEASGVDDEAYDKSTSWAKRILVIGNPYPADNNFFEQAVKGGSIDGFRKIIRITAEDSPNVITGIDEYPGLINLAEYKHRREHWSEFKQTIGLDAQFYAGADLMLFPAAVLADAKERARTLPSRRYGVAMGIDPAEGGDNTCWAIVDGKGLIMLVSKRTADTNVIIGETLQLIKQFAIEPGKVCFDAGGGGKQHADRLRAMGYPVQTVRFGESVSLDPKRGIVPLKHRLDVREEKYVYVNRRAELYGELSQKVAAGFGIPAQYSELLRQLSLFPYHYDGEGRMYIPSKNKRKPESKERTLIDIIGNSPDEADALAVAVHAMTKRSHRVTVGVA